MDLSPDGEVAAGFDLTGRAWRFSEGVFELIPDLFAFGFGFLQPLTVEMTDDGRRILGNTGPTLAPALWDEGIGIRPLEDLAIEAGLSLDGWTLLNERGMSEDGRVIVGDAKDANGISHA